MISYKSSPDIEYNGTENCARMQLFADTSTELTGVTHFDGIRLLQGSAAYVIGSGEKWMLDGSGSWILQPSDNAWQNVYTKAEIDSMIIEIYGIIAYYHTVIISDTGEIIFYALAGYIATWKIYGNGQQTESQTPEFVGVRTANLFDESTITTGAFAILTGLRESTGYYCSDYIPITDTTYYFQNVVGRSSQNAIVVYDANKQGLRYISIAGGSATSGSATFQSGDAYIRINCASGTDVSTVMANLGSTALPYEPYGYKIPISCGGVTNNIYLSAPLRKAIDGTDAVDTLQSTGTLTRNVDENGDALVTPTTETITVPDIPTLQGENTLTVDTDLIPSRIEIQG